MRILVLTPSFLPTIGGLQMGVHYLSREWRSMGHEVLVANMSAGRPTHPEANYAVTRLRPLRGGYRFGWHRLPWRWWMQRQLARTIREFAPDVISAHFAYPCAVWLGNVAPTVPWSVTCRGADVQVLADQGLGHRLRLDIDAALGRGLGQATKVIALSENLEQRVKSLGVAAASVVRIPNGADPRLRDCRMSSDARSIIGLPAGAAYLLSVGSHQVKKGFDAGVPAFAKIAAKWPDTYYVFVGKGTIALREIARAHGIAERIRTCEELMGPELWAVFQQARVYVLPSRIEGFPQVGCQAVMAGLPLVGTACPGNVDLIAPEVNGLLCPVDDLDAMALALHRLLSDPELRDALARGSEERRAQYDWRRIAAAHLDALGVSSEEQGA